VLPLAPPPPAPLLAALGTPAVAALVAGGVILLWAVATFNGLVRQRNKVREAFSGVDVQLKRRHDLVPNLVKVVGAYAKHERDTLEEVVRARTEAEAAAAVPDRERTEEGLSRSLDRLVALVERYPDLKADENFRRLQADLVEIEDHLQYARRYYNGTVRDWNTAIEQVPARFVAAAMGARPEPFFQLDAASERERPDVAL
jgi:LemA protein